MVHVLAVGARVGEAFQALGTLKGLFATVQPFVFGEVVFVFERLRTFDAFVGTLTWNARENENFTTFSFLVQHFST
jgi:hypothetical protein